MKKIIEWFKSSASDFVLFLIFLVLLNFVGSNAYLRLDLTKEKSYSLSKASKTLVKNLDEPVSIRVFFDKNLPSQYATITTYVEDLLEEYKRAANKNFTVSFMDMSKEDNQELAYNYGLRQIQIQEVSNNEIGVKQVYMGLAVSYGDNVELMDPITSSDGFEYNLTSTISKMMNTAAGLENLKGDDKIKVYVILSNAIKSLRVSGVTEMEEIVEDACRNINKKKMDKLDFTVIHPAVDEVAAYTERYGIQPINFRNDSGVAETGCLGVVAEYGERFVTLPVEIQDIFFNNYAVVGLDDIETTINDSIQTLITKPTQFGYIVGHGEKDLMTDSGAPGFDAALSSLYEIVTLDLSEDDIPASMKSIVINGPQMDMTEEELYKIDQFIMKGGNVLFLMEPCLENQQNTMYGTMTTYTENSVNLERLINKYGVSLEHSYVMDETCCESYNNTYGILELYWAPLLQKEHMNAKNAITANLGNVVMLQTAPLTVEEKAGVKSTVLVESSAKAWTEQPDGLMLNPLMIAPPENEADFSKKTLMVLLEGEFESAFDEAPVSTSAEDEAAGDGDYKLINHLSKSRQSGKIIVAGSSQISTTQVFTEDANSGVALLLINAIDYLNGNEDLCRMRTKGVSLNVLNTESKAKVTFWQMFNEYGLALLVLIAGLITWRMRIKRKARINRQYNPDDDRFIEKTSKKEKSEANA
ncbi:MAG: Gldg family protein [Treponema sp.]|nr:Gldg family protein [Treponema sp.]